MQTKFSVFCLVIDGRVHFFLVREVDALAVQLIHIFNDVFVNLAQRLLLIEALVCKVLVLASFFCANIDG